MSDIKVSGKIKVKSFQTEFCQKYPFLVPTITDKSGTRLDNDYTFAHCHSISTGAYKPLAIDDMSINGNLSIGTLEKRFLEIFSLHCEVIYKKSGRHYKTNSKYDKLSISEANKLLESENAEKIVISDITSYK